MDARSWPDAPTLGYNVRESEEAVVGAYYAVMAESGVEDGTAHFEGETNEIVVFVKMATPPSDAEKAELERAAERGAKESTRPNITNTFTGNVVRYTDRKFSSTRPAWKSRI